MLIDLWLWFVGPHLGWVPSLRRWFVCRLWHPTSAHEQIGVGVEGGYQYRCGPCGREFWGWS